MDRCRLVATRELVVVASWMPQRGRGGVVSVSVNGRLVGEVLRKRDQISVKLSSSEPSAIDISVRTWGVARVHRNAVFRAELDPSMLGALCLVYCAHGYLWPLVKSKPARVLLWRSDALRVPHPRLWRVGFNGVPRGAEELPVLGPT
jgi:hypothetical protein